MSDRKLSFDDDKPRDKRVMQTIYLAPSLKAEIDRLRGKITRSEWIERAIVAKLKADRP